MPQLALGVPHRISGDIRIAFRGHGRARFRLQHTGTRNGEPDALTWCDVSQISNGALAHPRAAIDADSMVRGMLIDTIDGDTDVLYRRHSADWIRIVPLDEDDEDNVEVCGQYQITIEPIGYPDVAVVA